MKRSIMIAYLLLPYFFISTALAQESYFEKLYQQTEILYTVQPTTDNGYILSGLRPAGSENHIILMKVNANGDTIWTKNYPGMSETEAYRTSAIQTSDGGYLLLGTTEDEHSSLFLIKANVDGETDWQKSYGDSLRLRSWSVQQTFDGGYLISVIQGTNTLYLLKVDQTGNILWKNGFGQILSFSVRYQAIQTADSGYVIASRLGLQKLSHDGDIVWTKSFDKRYYLVRELSDKSLIIAGENTLLKTDLTGVELWQQQIEIIPNALTTTESDVIILAGDQLMRLDSEGDEIWNLEMDGQIYDVNPVENNIISCGKFPTMPEERRGWLVKTESDGYYKSLILLQPHELPDSRRYGNIKIFIPYEITWRSYNIEEIDIDYSPNNGYDWIPLEEQYPAYESSYQWTPEGFPTSEGLIKISETAHPDFSDQTSHPFMVVRNYDHIAINDIVMYFSNFGYGSHNPQTDGPGLYWPGGKNVEKAAIYKDGLIWGGVVDGEIRADGNTHSGYQQPGVIFPDGSTGNPDSTLYSIWKIRYDWGIYPPGWERDRLEYDYKNWPVKIGAPWIDHNLNGDYDPGIDQPKLYGDETNWFVMNDLDTIASIAHKGSYPIGLEFQCTIYGFNRQDILKDVVFKKYRIINKGQNVADPMYLGYWSDPDLGDAGDDFVGSDTLLDLVYCYNGDNEDGDVTGWGYGISPPAVGYLLLQSPVLQSLSNDSAYYNDRWINDYKNIGMTSSYIYVNPSNTFRDPQCRLGAEEMYNNLRGLHWNGNPIIHPHSGETTTFVLTGDPIAESGWYEGAGWPGGFEPDDRRMLLGTGPFNFAPGDTQEIVIAIVLAQGEDHLDSVTKLKEKAAAVRQFYFTGDLTGIGHQVSTQPSSFRLEQNYPNPFNPTTAIGYRLSAVSKVDLSIYNVLGQKVVTLVSEKQKAGLHQVEWDASRFASGIYFYILRAGEYRDVKKMVLLR